MKALYLECFSGISGDMFLGAMVDLGMPEVYLKEQLLKLGIEGYDIDCKDDIKNGISGTRLSVNCKEHHHHRKFKDIRDIINNSSLGEPIKSISIDIFQKVAVAEAKIHGKSVDEVHFHEVGAIDSIVDIVGAAIAIDFFKPETIIASPIELGSGFAQCAHGKFPVPAPATAEILKDVPVTTGNQNFEATTPTGAAIIKTIVNDFSANKSFVVSKTAYGIGYKSGDVPNVLRASLCESEKPEQKVHHFMVECNIDDMNPEITGYIMDKLFEAGAEDVFITPIIMKKSRNGSKISVLCNEREMQIISDILLTETTTFGLRYYKVGKTALQRDFVELETKFGKVKIKRAYLNDEMVKQKPEYEDCLSISKRMNLPLQKVYAEIEKVMLDYEKKA